MNPALIIYNALLRPRRLLAFLEGGWYAVVQAVVAMLVWVGAIFAFIGLILRQSIGIEPRGLVMSLVVAPLMVFGGSGLGIVTNTSRAEPRASIPFWLLRCQIAITPVLALVVAFGFSTTLLSAQQNAWLGVGLLILVGVWFGSGVTVALDLRARRDEVAGTRWVLAGGALVIGAALWWSAPLRATEWVFTAPFCLGAALGVLRPLSYLWQAAWSLVLAQADRQHTAPFARLPLHPASYDDLCLLPLPGLRGLLLRACAADCARGGAWLLRIAEHPSQRRAAYRALDDAAHDPQVAHPLLFWLSTTMGGAHLLRAVVEARDRPPPLIAAYAAFAQVARPEDWVEVLARHHPAVAEAAAFSGGQALLTLLETSAHALNADRWSTAAAAIRAAPAPPADTQPLNVARTRLRAWIAHQPLRALDDRTAAVQTLVTDLDGLDGWPVALLSTVGEQLLFLLGVEQKRMH